MLLTNHILFLITCFSFLVAVTASNIVHHINTSSTPSHTTTPSIAYHNLPHPSNSNNSHHPQPPPPPPHHKHLHAHCKTDFECGRNALCIGKQQQQQPPLPKSCHCKLGFSQAPNKIDCKQVHCSTNAICTAHFGHRTKCTRSHSLGSYCSCASEKYLKLDENSQTCVPARCGKSRGRNWGCSEGMFCYYGRCRCKLGYLPLPNGYQCKLAHCRADSECKRFDYNARCFASSSSENSESSVFGTCDCDHGYYLDRRSHLCLPNLESFTTTRNVFFIVASFIFLIPTVICLIRACQSRREQRRSLGSDQVEGVEMAATSGTARVSRNGSGIISPVNNAVSRHRILNVLVRLSGERRQQMMVAGNAAQLAETFKPPIPDLPPSYEVISAESLEIKNADTLVKIAPIISSTTPPPPAYETVLHR